MSIFDPHGNEKRCPICDSDLEYNPLIRGWECVQSHEPEPEDARIQAEENIIRLKKDARIQAERIRELEAFNASLQEDSRLNTIRLREHEAANVLTVETLRSMRTTIERMKTALTTITNTTVILGQSDSAFTTWRECTRLAQEALEVKK